MIFIRIILGLIIIATCIASMKYVVQIVNVTGKVGFAEKYFAAPLAGTYSFYRLVAIFIIGVTILWMIGKLTIIPI
jgi:hypothetical protein